MTTSPDVSGPVLIVEDDILIREGLRAAFEDAGAGDVHCCGTVAAAMERLAGLDPEILVLDVGLADRDDGWGLAELALQLSSNPPLVIFATGRSESIPAEVAALGLVIEKPCLPEEVVEAAGRALGDDKLLARIGKRLRVRRD